MLLINRNSYPSVEELARLELRIAGLRINPNNFAPSRQLLVINNFTLKNIKTGQNFQVTGLPSPLAVSSPSWSPDEKKIVFTQTNANNVDLYEVDVATHKAAKINKKPLNVVLGSSITWEDNNTLLYRVTIKTASAAPPKPLMPKGPTVQQILCKAAPSATYEDLIKSPYDEQLFEFYATTQLVQNKNGAETAIGKPAIYTSVSISPDKKYLLERTYWDDPKLYYDMSPFSFADKIKTPILLIHGDADDNPGTFPINSERLFNAIKGFGGTVRFVFLPYEAHGYRGKENLLHKLWGINTWMDKYVKNAKPTNPPVTKPDLGSK